METHPVLTGVVLTHLLGFLDAISLGRLRRVSHHFRSRVEIYGINVEEVRLEDRFWSALVNGVLHRVMDGPGQTLGSGRMFLRPGRIVIFGYIHPHRMLNFHCMNWITLKYHLLLEEVLLNADLWISLSLLFTPNVLSVHITNCPTLGFSGNEIALVVCAMRLRSMTIEFTRLDRIRYALFRYNDSVAMVLPCLGWVNSFTTLFLSRHTFCSVGGSPRGILILNIHRRFQDEDETLIREESRLGSVCLHGSGESIRHLLFEALKMWSRNAIRQPFVFHSDFVHNAVNRVFPALHHTFTSYLQLHPGPIIDFLRIGRENGFDYFEFSCKINRIPFAIRLESCEEETEDRLGDLRNN